MENITVSGATPAGSSISTVISWPSMTGDQYSTGFIVCVASGTIAGEGFHNLLA